MLDVQRGAWSRAGFDESFQQSIFGFIFKHECFISDRMSAKEQEWGKLGSQVAALRISGMGPGLRQHASEQVP